MKRVHQSQLFSGYNSKSISEMIEIVLGNYMGKSERILLFKARFRMISSPKKVVQTSPSITFYTHGC